MVMLVTLFAYSTLFPLSHASESAITTVSTPLAASEAAPLALRKRSERPIANRNSTLLLLFLLFAIVPENFVQYLRRFPGIKLPG